MMQTATMFDRILFVSDEELVSEVSSDSGEAGVGMQFSDNERELC